jgi:hypothetical protein
MLALATVVTIGSAWNNLRTIANETAPGKLDCAVLGCAKLHLAFGLVLLGSIFATSIRGSSFAQRGAPTPKLGGRKPRRVLLDRENLPVSEGGLTRVRSAQKLVFTDPYRRSTAEVLLR